MSKFKNLSISTSILGFITVVIFTTFVLAGFVTYTIFFDTTTDLVETTSREINKQIIMNYDNYIDDVIDIANYAQEKTVDHTKHDDLATLSDTYYEIDQIEQNIASITLFNQYGTPLASSKSVSDIYGNMYFNDWFLNARADASIFHFSNPHTEDIYQNGTEEVITISRTVSYYDQGESTKGVLVIELKMDHFYELSTKTNLGEGGHLIILDEHYRTVFTNQEGCQYSVCASLTVSQEIVLGGDFVTIEDIEMYANVNTLANTRWRIATFVNVENISTAKQSVVYSLIFIFTLIFVLTVFISTVISKRISKPIYTLNNHMKKFQKGDLHSKVIVEGQKEVVVLADSFNVMIQEINTLMSEVMHEQKTKRKTQFIALQNQINPHFLYNTLDSIVWLSENKRNEDVVRMVVALSRFFRVGISNETSIIPLKEEVEHAKNYLSIQQIRYHDRFKYTFDIDASLEQSKVLKFSLQPLVENAIYHGISPDDDDNYIDVKATTNDDFIYLSVKNNGFGLSEEKIDEIRHQLTNQTSSKSIGLKNIYQRLQIYYGASSDLLIESKLDEYTIFTIKMPLKEGE